MGAEGWRHTDVSVISFSQPPPPPLPATSQVPIAIDRALIAIDGQPYMAAYRSRTRPSCPFNNWNKFSVDKEKQPQCLRFSDSQTNQTIQDLCCFCYQNEILPEQFSIEPQNPWDLEPISDLNQQQPESKSNSPETISSIQFVIN